MRTRIPILLLAAVVTAAPAAAQNREHQQMAAELRMLQEQAQQHALALSALADAIKAVNGAIADANQSTGVRFAGIENTLRGIATDLNAMRTRTDETNTLIRALSEDIESLRKTLVELPGRLQQQLNTLAAPPPAVDPNDPNAVAAAPGVGPVTPSIVVPPIDVGMTPTQMYETAFGDYAGGQWTSAITQFEQFLKVFPDSARAGAAQFYIGEAYVAMNRFEDAIRAYDAVIRNYSKQKDEYVPQALYKRGNTQLRIGQTEAARASFEELVKNYPDTSVAGNARQRLDGLLKSPPSK